MATIKAFLKRRPVPAYFVLALAISWGGILIVAAPGGVSARWRDRGAWPRWAAGRLKERKLS